MIKETELDFPKGAHEMLAQYLNIVAKSQESDWRYKIIPKEEFEIELREKLQNL